nr:MAG TPA: TIR domain [Caudoviricetes sp.]
MNHKLFISHSSIQKPYVEELLRFVGYDYAIVDKYTFESGKNLWDDIRMAIDSCDFFVYLISEESLQSEWVDHEIGYVRERIDENQIIFCPFIIDEKIDINHPKIKKWIKNAYLTDHFVHPRSLARLLKKKIRRSVWEQFPALKIQNHLFLGREQEIHALAEAYFNEGDYCKTSIIISGLPHVGRKRLLREFVATKVMVGGDPTDLIEIRMTDKDSIQEFAIQLNDIIEDYSYDELLDKVRDKDGALSITVQLLNRLHDIKEHIVINDDKCIVRGDGLLTEWFLDIVKHDSLKSRLYLNVASRFTPRPDLSEIFSNIVTYQIHPLKSTDMKTLFNAYALQKGLEVSSQDVNYFIEQFAGYPEQALFAVDTLDKSNVALARKKVQDIVSKFDNNYQAIVTDLKKDDRTFQILILLSFFEFISYDYLCRICGEDIVDVLEKFHYYSLTESFGSGKQYISLSPAIVDYIKRVKFKLSDIYQKRLHKMTREVLENTDDKISDISYRLYATKELLRQGGVNVDERYLIPSFVLKVIAEEYYDGHDDNVISLADRVLKSYHRSTYEAVIRNINYWLCCALCRKKDRRFFDEVKYFENSPYSFYFLNGFYFRHTRNYSKAKEYYKDALSHTREYDEDSYASKAEHEMVMVCMILGDYEEALELVEHSYNKNPSNTYHIESYFRCLVRSAHPDRDILQRLMSEMHKSFDSHREIIYDTMQAEYTYYVNGKFIDAINMLRPIIVNNKDKFRNYPLRSLREICRKRDAMQIYASILKLCKDFQEEADFDVVDK